MPIGLLAQLDPAVLAVPSLIDLARLYRYEPLTENPFRNGLSILIDAVQESPSLVLVRSSTSLRVVSYLWKLMRPSGSTAGWVALTPVAPLLSGCPTGM